MAKNIDKNHTFYLTDFKVYHYIKRKSLTRNLYVCPIFPEKILRIPAKYNGKLPSKNVLLWNPKSSPNQLMYEKYLYTRPTVYISSSYTDLIRLTNLRSSSDIIAYMVYLPHSQNAPWYKKIIRVGGGKCTVQDLIRIRLNWGQSFHTIIPVVTFLTPLA